MSRIERNSMDQVAAPRRVGRRLPGLVGMVVCVLALTACGPKTLWGWGSNSSGQLGDGSSSPQFIPAQIGTDTNWSTVSAGGTFTVGIRSDGTLWAWGSNGSGQLGDGTSTSRYAPTKIGVDTNWKTVSAGGSHTLAIRNDGTLWAWGWNWSGQLGDGTTDNRSTPTQIGSATNWKAVSAGGSRSVAVRSDGTMWAWGPRPECTLLFSCGSDSGYLVPTQIGTATNWASVSAGTFHTVAIRTDGTLRTWGVRGECSPLVEPDYCAGFERGYLVPTQIGTATNWKAVSAGTYHTLAIRTDGTLWAWGQNGAGQVGVPSAGVPWLEPRQVPDASNWTSVDAGRFHSVAIRADGTLWVWGGNSNGQLGFEWSEGDYPTSVPFPVQVGAGTDWATVDAGDLHTFATRTVPAE